MADPAKSCLTLHTWSGLVKDIGDGLRAVAAGTNWSGFIYTPQNAIFVRIAEDGKATDHKRGAVALDAAFEVRLFSGVLDARFRRDGDQWRAAVLTEDGGWKPPTGLALADKPVDISQGLRRGTQYLLWGGVHGRKDGWTTLATARIGKLHVPFVAEDRFKGLAITAVEYFRVAEHGNVVFAAERLTGFRGMKRLHETKMEAADA